MQLSTESMESTAVSAQQRIAPTQCRMKSNFRTRSAALKAAHDFIRRFGAGEVEYLEWDVDSQSMVVVGHQQRNQMLGWYKHWDDKPDPLAPFYT